jgi:hypothetical protein
MSMKVVDLQRRGDSPRADVLLELVQAGFEGSERVHWNDSGHARIVFGAEREDAREALAARLSAVGEDWREHILIL